MRPVRLPRTVLRRLPRRLVLHRLPRRPSLHRLPQLSLRRLPRSSLLLLACVPGLAAVLALVLCAVGVDRTRRRAERPPA
ncbi:N-acetylmuramoyl-L-alanine amidase, partial [Streptomyces ipomoeae]|nr:N-acetylmuramoyl-L-alanine amidase [Streptomyces ipomoeae]